MARTSIVSFLAGTWLFEVHMDPPFCLTEEGPAYRRLLNVCPSVCPSVCLSVCLSVHPSLSIWFSSILHSQYTSDLSLG